MKPRHSRGRVLSLGLLLGLAVSCSAGTSLVTTPATTPPSIVAPPTAPAPAPAPAPADWQITHAGKSGEIEGFADHTSVTPGQPLYLFVSTTARSYTVTAYRMGSATTEVWRSEPQQGREQAAAVLQAPTSTIVAPWQPSLTVSTERWAPGDYLFRLDADTGAQQFVPLTVRTESNAGRIVLVNAVTTWQAYNRWGGYSLYDSPSGKKSERSRAVSFDRPYQAEAMQGAGDFLFFELPFVAFAEQSGHQLGYATDIDLHADPHLLDGARAVITLGHDEYWSAAMRNNTTRARDSGVNLAFLGGNEVYRHIRFGPTSLGPDRLEIDYKSFAEDPASASTPLDATQEWRSPPTPRPESALLGNIYKCNPVSADLVVSDANSWLLQGLVTDGQRLAGMVGNEYAQVDLSWPTPRPIDVLFHSPLTCHGAPGFADVTYYTAPGGSGVFSAGTQYWICGVDPQCPKARADDGSVLHTISAITTRLLDAYANGPAGARHPAVDNLQQLHVPGVTEPILPELPNALVPQ